MACRILLRYINCEKKMVFGSAFSNAYFKPICVCCASNTSSSRRSIYKAKEVKKFRFFVLQHYLDYLKSYNAILEKKFPGAMQVYRVFMDGMKEFFTDLKLYIKLVHSLNIAGKSLETFNVREVELYEQMPKDMRRIAPLLILSILPLTHYVLFPIAYYFPRHLLCRHFWNLQQKSEFNIILLRKRLVHNKPVFRHLQLQLPKLKENALHKKWSAVLGLVGSGLQPEPVQILGCKDLFVNGPHHLMYLSGNHVKHLLKMHELHMGWFRRTRLGDRAVILQAMDRAIIREGGVEILSADSLRQACLIRGLNPMNMKNEDMVNWLKGWIAVSSEIDKDSLSLLLHCPILLAYNEPTNWQLIYDTKQPKL